MTVRWHSNDNEKIDGHTAGTLVNRSFWLNELPRLILLCRLFGHRPVVDGYDTTTTMTRHAARWVACDRCGVRPHEQGDPDPAQWSIGQRYTGPFNDAPAPTKEECATQPYVRPAIPGPWPAQPTGTVGGQLIIGRSFGGAGVTLKIGNAGSENVLAASLRLNPIGALYLHTERHGTWLQRRLNPVGYHSRVFELSIHDGTLWWKVWAKRDESTRGTPRWRDGSTVINPLDRILGPVRHAFEKIGMPVTGTVRMPEGDTHEVVLQLEKVQTGRRRGRKVESWSVDWECRKGIAFRNDSWKGDNVLGSSVVVTRAAMDRGMWPEEACAQIAAAVSRDRSRYGWRAPDFGIEVD